MCISLKDNGWVNRGPTSRLNMMRLVADGSDVCDIFVKSREAMDQARLKSRPVLLLVNNLKRRFGHAATDRQIAYLTEGEIASLAETNHLKSKYNGNGKGCDMYLSCKDCWARLVFAYVFVLVICVVMTTGALELARTAGVFDGVDLSERYRYLWDCTEKAFQQAVNEEKITDRQRLCSSNAPPLVSIPSMTTDTTPRYSGLGAKQLAVASGGGASSGAALKVDSMRKHMTRVLDEALGGDSAAGERVVYIGEDVRHGGCVQLLPPITDRISAVAYNGV